MILTIWQINSLIIWLWLILKATTGKRDVLELNIELFFGLEAKLSFIGKIYGISWLLDSDLGSIYFLLLTFYAKISGDIFYWETVYFDMEATHFHVPARLSCIGSLAMRFSENGRGRWCRHSIQMSSKQISFTFRKILQLFFFFLFLRGTHEKLNSNLFTQSFNYLKKQKFIYQMLFI